MERGEEMVELDGFTFKDSLPLRGGNTGWCTFGKLDPEFTSRDVSVENSQRLASFPTAGALGRM